MIVLSLWNEFILQLCIEVGKWAVMYMNVKGMDLASLNNVSIGLWNSLAIVARLLFTLLGYDQLMTVKFILV
jgi:hypothetical protein